jgi:hypothetical protein
MTYFSLNPNDCGHHLKLGNYLVNLPKDSWFVVDYIDRAGRARRKEMSHGQARFVLRRAGYKLGRSRHQAALVVPGKALVKHE